MNNPHFLLHVKGSHKFYNQEVIYAYLHFPYLPNLNYVFLHFVPYLVTFHKAIVFLGTSLGNTKLVQPLTQFRIPVSVWGWFSDMGKIYYSYISLDFCFSFQIFGLNFCIQVEGMKMNKKAVIIYHISPVLQKRTALFWKKFNE